MRAVVAFFALGLLTAVPGWAAPRFSFEVAGDIPQKNHALLQETFQFAISQVRDLPPSRGNPLRSRSQRVVHFVFTSTHGEVAREVLDASQPTGQGGDSDAFTFTTDRGTHPPELRIYVFLLMDRLILDPETGKQRPDAFVRLVAALGHELYGNVPGQLKLRLGEPPAWTRESAREDEITAHRAGVAFLERYMASPFADSIDKSHLTSALEREQAALESWLKPPVPSPCPEGVRLFVFGRPPLR